MSEPQISDPALPPLSPERISHIKNLVKPKGFLYEEGSTEELSSNGLHKIIYSFIVNNYPNFPDRLNNNPNNQLQTFITAMNNIQQISFQRLNLSEQDEITQTQSYISNFSGFGQGNNALNNILFTYKEHFGNISIWNVADSQGVEMVRKEPFGPQIQTVNYLLPELNILFIDNRIILLIPCHDKFMKQNNETFLSSPASSLQDFILRSYIGIPWGNNDEFSDADSDDDSDGDGDGDGDGDENSEPTGVVTARAQAVAARKNNDRLIQEARDRITQLQTEIRNIGSRRLNPGPVTDQRDNRERRIRMRRNQITNIENTIRSYEELNRQLDQSMMLQNEAMFRRLQAQAQAEAEAQAQVEAEAQAQAQAQAEAEAQAAAAGESEEDGDNEDYTSNISSLFDEDEDDDY